MDAHEEIRREAIQDKEQPRRPARWTISLMGMAAIALLIFYFFLNQPLFGLIGSTKMKEGYVESEGIKIVFEETPLRELQEHYVENEEREIKACLKGKIVKGQYRVKELHLPMVIDSDVYHVKAERCPPGTIIDLHSHPVNKCKASEQDLKVYAKNKKSQPALLMMIMCSTTRYRVYHKT